MLCQRRLVGVVRVRVLANFRNRDGRNKCCLAFHIGVALRQNSDGRKPVVPKVISHQSESPAEDDDISGGEHQTQLLRWLLRILLSTSIWSKRELNQLAGVERPAVMFVKVELNKGGISGGLIIATVFEKRGHNMRFGLYACATRLARRLHVGFDGRTRPQRFRRHG